MDEVTIRRELTKPICLCNEPDALPGCVLKVFEFEDTKPKYLKEIHFSNYYTGRVSAKVCIEDAVSDTILNNVVTSDSSLGILHAILD